MGNVSGAELATRFTREYTVRYPIGNAGMAFVGTTPDVAVAVCRSGAVGSLAMGPLSAQVMKELIRAVRGCTEGPFNVNIITFLAERNQVLAWNPCL